MGKGIRKVVTFRLDEGELELLDRAVAALIRLHGGGFGGPTGGGFIREAVVRLARDVVSALPTYDPKAAGRLPERHFSYWEWEGRLEDCLRIAKPSAKERTLSHPGLGGDPSSSTSSPPASRITPSSSADAGGVLRPAAAAGLARERELREEGKAIAARHLGKRAKPRTWDEAAADAKAKTRASSASPSRW